MAQVFISYSRDDSDYIGQLTTSLQAHHLDPWMDTEIDSGEIWFKQITKAIINCSAVIVVMTPSAEESEWVHKEILLAKKHRKPIFPLLLKGEVFDLLIDIQFVAVKAGQLPKADFYQRIQQSIQTGEVKPSVTSLLSSEPLPDTLPMEKKSLAKPDQTDKIPLDSIHQTVTHTLGSLAIYLHGEFVRSQRFTKPMLLVGRMVDNDVVLEGNEISRNHASFEVRQDGCWITDLNSSNGIYLNGKKLAANESICLYGGETVSIGSYRLTYYPPTKL